jgi:hypothetical protein
MSMAPAVAVAGENLLSVGLAVLLMVAGILTMRQSPKARRLHYYFAWAKIPLSLLGGAAYGWMMMQFMTPLMSASGTPAPLNPWLFFWIYAAFPVVLGCAYPIGLLIALRSRSVRAYYNSIVAPAE